MAGEKRPPAFDDFDARLAKLRRPDAAPERAEGGEARPRWGDGLQVGIELVAGLGGGLLLGWAFDSWLGTAPILLVVGFMLGAAAGMLNAWRWMRRLEARMRDGGSGEGSP
jgi:ATP synthase protein I